MRKNPFIIDPENKREVRRRAKEAYQNAKIALKGAQRCIDNPLFKKYQDDYLRAEESLIGALLAYSEPDPLKYAFNVSRMIERLRDLRVLLVDVRRDASRKLPKGEFDQEENSE